jgi:hypothetical protein
MKKKMLIICTIVFFCTGTFVFAQAKPKAVLAKSDIDNFLKNYEKIVQIIDSHDSEFSSIDMDLSDKEGRELTDAILKARNFSVSAKLREELSALGMGNNGFEKCLVIIFGTGIAFLENMIASIKNMDGGADSKELDEIIKNQINPIKAAIHDSDYKLIVSRKDDLMSILE